MGHTNWQSYQIRRNKSSTHANVTAEEWLILTIENRTLTNSSRTECKSLYLHVQLSTGNGFQLTGWTAAFSLWSIVGKTAENDGVASPLATNRFAILLNCSATDKKTVQHQTSKTKAEFWIRYESGQNELVQCNAYIYNQHVFAFPSTQSENYCQLTWIHLRADVTVTTAPSGTPVKGWHTSQQLIKSECRFFSKFSMVATYGRETLRSVPKFMLRSACDQA